jgi:membrane dipeptidase
MKISHWAVWGATTAALLLGGAALKPLHHKPAPDQPLMINLDTHLDTPEHFGRAGWDIMKRHTYANDLTQVDYPRMVAGKLDGGFFAIFTPQGPLTPEGYAAARDKALLRAAHIREMVAAHRDTFELAFTADDAVRIKKEGKRIVFQSIENSYPMGEDLSLFQTFYKFGVRLAGPVHFLNNQFADSATDKPRWHGLSPAGRAWVKEANRLGVIIDASHASDDVFDQLLEQSKTPIILSHSGLKAIFDHPRNIDDERLKKLAAAGGVIQINSVYLAPNPPGQGLGPPAARTDVIEDLSVADQKKMIADVQAYYALHPQVYAASFDLFMKAMLHAIQVAGVDHVGIGCDWDGGGGVKGMEDIASLPKISAALKKAGYSDADVAKIWGGNVLRVMHQVEAYRDGIKGKPAG